MLRRFLAVLLTCFILLPAVARPEDEAAPFDADLQRFAEILGSLHYLAGLCDPGPSPYRGQMTALLDAEAPEAAFRAQLVDRFNLGFSSFAAVHSTAAGERNPKCSWSACRIMSDALRFTG